MDARTVVGIFVDETCCSSFCTYLTSLLEGNNYSSAVFLQAKEHLDESHSTLRFASRAKRVVNNAVVNEVQTLLHCVCSLHQLASSTLHENRRAVVLLIRLGRATIPTAMLRRSCRMRQCSSARPVRSSSCARSSAPTGAPLCALRQGPSLRSPMPEVSTHT